MLARKNRVTMRDHSAEANLFARRSFVAFVFIALCMAALLSNLYQLQVVRHQEYQTRSNDNRIKVIPIAPNRGLIYDRNGVLLADNVPVYSLEIIPEKAGDLAKTVAELAELFSLDQEAVDDFLQQAKFKRRFTSLPLINNLSEQQVALFSVNQHKFPGASVEARLARYYPQGDLFTHALGYVGKINLKELQKLDEENKSANYEATRDIGKQGIEKYYEDYLHGQIGYQEVEVNSRGRTLRVLRFEPPKPGDDLTLSIDIKLQQAAKDALSGKRGAVVALDPRDGSVLALYSNPSYDPNLFVHGISGKDYRGLLQDSDRPLLNRTTQGRYPPASTIKPFLGLLGLEERAITEASRIYDPGFFRLPNVERAWKDHIAWGHGSVDIHLALEASCDTYFWDLANKLGIDKISPYMSKFGFGELSGIDLYEESSAIMPSREWKKERLKQAWYPGDTINIGIGQSYWTATPIQLAQALNIFVNYGEIKRPHMLMARKQNEQVLLTEPDRMAPIEVKDKYNWQVIMKAMHTTVAKANGTAHTAFKGHFYHAAGKTGTAQVYSVAKGEKYDKKTVADHLRDNAMFIGYAPYESPEIVLAVTVENAGGGGGNAAPIARKVMDSYFEGRKFD